jgi:hypothetical protein
MWMRCLEGDIDMLDRLAGSVFAARAAADRDVQNRKECAAQRHCVRSVSWPWSIALTQGAVRSKENESGVFAHELLQEMLRHSANITRFDSKGYSCLHYAARNKHLNVVQALIQVPALSACGRSLRALSPRSAPTRHRSTADRSGTVQNFVPVDAVPDPSNDEFMAQWYMVDNFDGRTALHLAAAAGPAALSALFAAFVLSATT